MLGKGFRALLLTLLLLLGIGLPAAETASLSDPELDEIVAAGLFFEINLQNGFIRVEITSNSLPSSNGNGPGLPVQLVGNVNLTGNAQAGLQAVGNQVIAGGIGQLSINILMIQAQGNININTLIQTGLQAISF